MAKHDIRMNRSGTIGSKIKRRRIVSVALASLATLALLGVVAAAWLGSKASTINNELNAATRLIPSLKEELSATKPEEAQATVNQLRAHTAAAKDAAGDPVWTLASAVPLLGINLSSIAEVARSADDVVNLGLVPLVDTLGSLNWDSVLPNEAGTDLKPLEAASPSVTSAAQAVRLSAERLNRIDAGQLVPQVSEPLENAREQLNEVTGTLDAAADAARITPAMLGNSEPRNYLLMIQNNAEARASGGIPGALAVLNIAQGKLTLTDQSSANDVGIMAPVLSVDAQQQAIYSSRLGKFMQDVNLTPDFPTAASTAQAMWERKTNQRVDGVISIDPVSLSYVLEATGPIKIASSEMAQVASSGLPTELDSANVVPTLLSDVYAKIENTDLQDAYFAGVAKEIFSALASGDTDAKRLIEGVTRGAEEGRVLVWSGRNEEQSIISKYGLGGSVTGPSISPAQFGVYFNDGTGAKMDFYVTRTVQLIKECPRDGYEQTTVRVTSTNAAPSDAATSLPAYVTGSGHFGVPPGSVQTNIVAYGPSQANVETVKLDGQRTDFAPYVHSNRPVGILATRLAPGETKTVDITFGKIVQHTEPDLFVTPSVQPVNEVKLATEDAACT